MRSTRIVSGVMALAIALTMTLVVTGSSTTTAAQAKPRHALIAKGKEIRDSGKFKAYGKVTTFKGRKITVQRKIGSNAYKFFKRTKTKQDTGKFSARVYGPTGACFKVVVPATKNYRKTQKVIGCLVAEK